MTFSITPRFSGFNEINAPVFLHDALFFLFFLALLIPRPVAPFNSGFEGDSSEAEPSFCGDFPSSL
jgi:hypothetical protein